MSKANDATDFAPAERAAAQTISRQSDLFQSFRPPAGLFDAAFGGLLVLNRHRQIVYCNSALSNMLGAGEPGLLLGMRPGEALQCPNSQTVGGCGTSKHCSTCGAVLAILGSQLGREELRECRITCGPRGEAMELLVRTAPLEIGEEQFCVLAVTDISHQKRLKALERTFFHDLMNTATGLLIQAEHLARQAGSTCSPVARNICDGLRRLTDEVKSHRDLMAAEKHGLPVRPITVSSLELLKDLLQSYQLPAQSHGCTIEMDPGAADVSLHTDVTIMSRILGNMLKNAMEASTAGQIVNVGCRHEKSEVAFWVHNSAHMAGEVQLQVFQRSFSTKGEGRGLGTYSMKLLCERYLGGRVSFTSSPEEGTTFTASLPLEAPSASAL